MLIGAVRYPIVLAHGAAGFDQLFGVYAAAATAGLAALDADRDASRRPGLPSRTRHAVAFFTVV